MAIHGVSPEKESAEPSIAKLDDNQRAALDIARKRAMERKRIEFLNKG